MFPDVLKPFRPASADFFADGLPFPSLNMRRDFYRRRFESSVFGCHAMLPPPEVSKNVKSKEEPSAYPSGQDTSFLNLTPMPYRFTEKALPAVNVRLSPQKAKPPPPPSYMTTSSEIGKLGLSETDLPMRWYGRMGQFTSSWVAPPSQMVSTGLGTAMDRSNYHPSYAAPQREPRCSLPPMALAAQAAHAPSFSVAVTSRSMRPHLACALLLFSQARPRMEWPPGPHRLQRC